ncbi:hypothetical protein [Nonomuraea sp. NPDC050783]|uniref:hypothetical protein n=1 Tax=Nonomuraea sp. NPDC050783 TaxID=3154634 RepID=UPI003466607A
MKGNLIAVAGLLGAAVAIVGLAGPANAHTVCDLSVNDDTHTLGIDAHGVFAGRRDAEACKDRYSWHDHRDWNKDEGWGKDEDWGRWRSHEHGSGWGGPGWGGSDWSDSGHGWGRESRYPVNRIGRF